MAPSEKRTTSQQRTKVLLPMCPLFGGSTISVRILLLFINNAKFTSINRLALEVLLLDETHQILWITNHIRGALGYRIELEKCI